jgi:cytochrome c peroxidase
VSSVRVFVGWSTVAAAIAFGGSRAPYPAPLPPPPAAANCALFGAEAASATGESCSACHQNRGDGNHPVDFDYEAARAGSERLRSAQEVVRRGVFLPDGQVRCTTCHSARSPWKDRIALPPGSVAEPAVVPGDPKTYDPELRRRAMVSAGSAVTAKPLCLACHAMD